MDCTRGVAATVIHSGIASAAQVSELDPVFAARLGLHSSARVLLVPVLLKERVAALLMALSSQDGDLAGLELLVQVAQLALDLQSYRKTPPHPAPVPPHPAEPEHRVVAPPYAAPVPPEPVYATPPAHNVAPPQAYHPAPGPSYSAMPIRTVYAPEPPAPHLAMPAMRESMAHPQSVAPVADEAHEKARRFAKLLVEEIKLYNQTKVAEGRARGDLYSRLHEDIEKSRAAYQKRYGESVRDVDYFTQELIRILSDNNPAVMGPGFPG
jgi:hypothetical protein